MGIYIPNMGADQFDKLCEEKGLKFVYTAVSTPHGRLIDADKMEDEYKKKYGVSICFGGVPTVIEAEE